MIHFDQSPEYVAWAANVLKIHPKYFGNCTTLAFSHRGELVGVALYSRYNSINVEITIATTSPKWCSKQTLRAMFRYPFVQMKAKRMTAICRAGNARVRDIMARGGFIQEGELRHFYEDGENACIYGILPHEAERWING